MTSLGGAVTGRVQLHCSALALVLAMASCGGGDVASDDDAGVTAESTAAAEDDGAGEAGGGGGGGCPVDECDDGLLDELSSIPIPPTVDAYAYGTTDRTDGLITQQLFVSGSIADLEAFYDAELESAGFTVDTTVAEGGQYAAFFTDPEGRSGSISAGPREFHPLVLDIGLDAG